MKLQILIGAFLLVVGLHFSNRALNATPRYMDSSASTATPGDGVVREKFTVGFLPVT